MDILQTLMKKQELTKQHQVVPVTLIERETTKKA
jgi:DNA-binding LacI/PurR family transcriptional regulator